MDEYRSSAATYRSEVTRVLPECERVRSTIMDHAVRGPLYR
jgi:hypothetical protein